MKIHEDYGELQISRNENEMEDEQKSTITIMQDN